MGTLDFDFEAPVLPETSTTIGAILRMAGVCFNCPCGYHTQGCDCGCPDVLPEWAHRV